MSSRAKQANEGLNLIGKVSAVSGGTQGIGAGIGIRLAQAGSSVYIIGRNAELGNSVVEKMRRVSAEGVPDQPKTSATSAAAAAAKYEFIQADLSTVSGIKDVAQKLETKAGGRGIDYLFETQGGPPNGKWTETPEGIEQHFAVQCLSRFGLHYLLAKSNTLKEAAVYVAAPGGSKAGEIDLDDLELRQARERNKFGILASGKRDGAVLDCAAFEMSKRFPSTRTYHVFPGYVVTDAAQNAGFPYLIVLLAKLAAPITTRTIANTPATYADIPVYLAANPSSRQESGLEFSNQRLKPQGVAEWVKDDSKRSKVIDQLLKWFQ